MIKANLTVHRRVPGIIFCCLLLSSICMLAGINAQANPDPKSLGDLLIARGAVVNEMSATAGLTVVSGSRIKTNFGGRAIINLGELGRVTLGSEAEIMLTFDEGRIGGELLSGWVVVSAPKGISVALKTADGIAIADGKDESSLRIDVTSGTTRVEANGGAQLVSDEKSEFVAAGEEVELSRLDGSLAIARHTLESTSTDTEAQTKSFGQLLSMSLRGAVEGVTFNRTLAGTSTRPLTRSLDRATGPGALHLTESSQQITCDPRCPGVEVFPDLVKAKAGCPPIPFTVYFTPSAPVASKVQVKPYFSGACFTISPSVPVIIPSGGSYGFVLNASSCPADADKDIENSKVEIITDTAGTKVIEVEWAKSCLRTLK